MSKGDLIEVEGTIQNALGGGQYSILTEEGRELRAKVGGKLKNNHIRVIPGDKIRVAVSPYDLTHGIIVRRHR